MLFLVYDGSITLGECYHQFFRMFIGSFVRSLRKKPAFNLCPSSPLGKNLLCCTWALMTQSVREYVYPYCQWPLRDISKLLNHSCYRDSVTHSANGELKLLHLFHHICCVSTSPTHVCDLFLHLVLSCIWLKVQLNRCIQHLCYTICYYIWLSHVDWSWDIYIQPVTVCTASHCLTSHPSWS